MKKTDFSYLSADQKTMIHATYWEPEQEPVAILQIAHGITEYIDRYSGVAEFFTIKVAESSAPNGLNTQTSIVKNGGAKTRRYEGHTADP